MKKKLFKVLAGCAAICFVSGVIVSVNANKAVAEDAAAVICNFDFEDGALPTDEHVSSSGATFEIVDNMNSQMYDDPGSKCLKVSGRASGQDWWERVGFRYNMKDLEPGKKYDISVDVYHENGAATTSKGEYQEVRAFKMATYFADGEQNYDSLPSEDKEKVTPMYSQVGDVAGCWQGEWERIAGTLTVKEDTKGKDYIICVFMGYPEATDATGGAYQDENTEDYYMDNFVIKEHVDPTPSPVPTDEPTPAPQDSGTPQTPAQPGPAAPETAGQPQAGGQPALAAGYTDTVNKIKYEVTDASSVTVIGASGKKVNIPDTVTINGQECKVTAIAANAFKGSKIKSVTIGANVKNVGKNAFAKCSKLTKVTIKSDSIKFGKKAFSGINKKATVKVPKAAKKAYTKNLKKAGLPKTAKIK